MSDRGEPLLRLLDDLCYVFECLALDYTGEAKDALSQLGARLEAGDEHRIGVPGLLATLRRARGELNVDRMGATGELAALSRRIWAMLPRDVDSG